MFTTEQIRIEIATEYRGAHSALRCARKARETGAAGSADVVAHALDFVRWHRATIAGMRRTLELRRLALEGRPR